MIEVFKYEDVSEEACILKCLEDLDVYNNEIISKEYEEDNKFKMEVVKKDNVKNFIKDYLSFIALKMGLELKSEINEEENIYSVKMFSDNNPILIGKDGRTLTSIQQLLRQTLSNKTGINIKVNLDASNYKEKKVKFFERDIKKIINDVMRTKDEIKLDSMNSYNRRIVHSIASEYYNIETESFGEEPNRYVIIRYIEK